MDAALLESVLTNRVNENGFKKILSVDHEPAVPKGQNFLSTVKRLKMRVLLADGRVVTRSTILKDSDVPHVDLLIDKGIFKAETSMYLKVLREMEYLMDEFQSTEDVLWCKLLHHVPYSSMLFEDLKALGFKSLLVPCYLDLEHVDLVLRNLGLYHGMSKVLEERGIISENDFSHWYVFNKSSCKVWHAYLQEFVNIIDKKWDPSWKPITNKLQKVTIKDLQDKLDEMERCPEGTFKVLNHGDCIVPNIMFKYDWKNRPIAMRFVDFQLPTFGTPCFDLTYSLSRVIKTSFKKKHFNHLMECYYTSLMSSLDMFNFQGRKPTLEELMAEMERLSFLSSILAAINYAPFVAQNDKFGSDEQRDRIFGIYNRHDSEKEMGPNIKEFVEKHLS